MLIEYIRQNRATRQYADGHLIYLTDEVGRAAKDFHETSITTASVQVEQCRTELDRLASELSATRLHIDNPALLAIHRERIDEIRLSLEQANSSL